MRRATVLVTDGEQRSALAVVRSLGRAGHRVRVAASRRGSLAAASRHCRGDDVVADPLTDPATFRDAIARLTSEHRADVVLPITEPSLLALLPARRALGGAALPFVDEPVFRAVADKDALLRAARGLGIAVPRQRLARSAAELAALAGELAYPVVLKPARSVGEANGRRVKQGVVHAADAAALARAAAALDDAAFPLLVQRRIVGPGVGIFLLRWDGRSIARFAHRRIREKPPSGGISVSCESVAADPALVERSEALLDAFAWRGVAMVEYKVDGATGVPHLMEVNGRFWGSLQLAIDCGVDFPALLVALALGERPAPVETWAVGRRNRWWWGEVDHLLARLRHPPARLALPPGSPPVLGALGDLALPWRPRRRGEVLRLDDPFPFVRESLDWLRGR